MESNEIIDLISVRAIEIAGDSARDWERLCWMAVHEYHHGSLPMEYDIREIDEDLYLAVLNKLKQINKN